MESKAGLYIDALGNAHKPASRDARIVSLVPSITELIADLGLADQLVGRTRWCIHPADVVKDVPAIGGTKKVNLDKLRDLRPSHVIVNVDENPREMADAIAAFVPHVIVTHPMSPRDNLELYGLMGGIFGRTAQAEALCRGFDEAYNGLAEAAKALPRRRVLYLIWKDPWMSVSPDTYISRTLALVNWETVGGNDERYPKVEMDSDLLANIDLVLFSSEPFAFNEKHLREFSNAYDCEREKLLLIDGEMTSWYGSRAIEGLRYLGALAAEIAER